MAKQTERRHSLIEDRYLEDFATVAVYFIITVAVGLSLLAVVVYWLLNEMPNM